MKYAFLLVCLLISACNSDYSHELPNNYQLSRFYSGSSGIVNPDSRIIVGPSEYGIVLAVVGQYVLGNLDTEEEAFDVPEVPDRYFLIDTSVGVIFKELSHAAYREKLKEFSIQEVKLHRPNKLGLK